MNGPEILHIIKRDLRRAVAQRDAPPSPKPVKVSPWVAMSLLQKAIRRGQEHLALSAAATLLRDAPEKLWRRLGCIAYEDVGLARLEAVALATAALGGKRSRQDLGGEWEVASTLVFELSRAPKCRAADDLLMSCQLHPALAEARSELAHLPPRGLVEIATGRGPVQERALALWYALGTERGSTGLLPRRGHPALVFDLLCEAGWPHSVVEVSREGFRRTREMLCPLLALLACEPPQSPEIKDDDEFPPELIIGDTPSWALDVYTREGRAAFVGFLQTDARSARWIRRNLRPARRIALLGHIVFRVEGGLVTNRMHWPLADELRRQVDLECAGPECPDAREMLAMIREDIPRLNEVRAEIGSARHD
jgi:hypothetical protein